MAYPALGPNYGPGTPIDIADQNKLWGGSDKTNGFLHRNVDGRIPALRESWSRIIIDPANPLYTDNAVTWGNGFWYDLANIDTQPHALHAEKPATSQFAGILLFEQGRQTGNPILPYGLPAYSTGTLVRLGEIGYKTALFSLGVADDYYAYLKGDASKDVPTVRSTFKDWLALLKAAADGSKLGLFFDNNSGFPYVAVVAAASLANPTVAGATFGGFATIVEPENEAIFFHIHP
jgi:hypothetical protein